MKVGPPPIMNYGVSMLTLPLTLAHIPTHTYTHASTHALQLADLCLISVHLDLTPELLAAAIKECFEGDIVNNARSMGHQLR